MQKTQDQFDVLVVGSGASGGWAVKRLTEAGVRVALVDAGRPLAAGDYSEHKQPYDLRYRGRAPSVVGKTRPRQRDCYACTEYNYDWFANDLEEPYTTPEGKPFSWQGRMRVTGGRTNVWGRQSYRLSQQDLKGKSFDGQGADWPLNYDDLVPYYEIVEDYVGISGMTEHVPELPDSKFLPPMELTCAERRVRERIKAKYDRTLTIGRTANLTRPLNGRSACHYCGPCERGCVTHSYFNSAFTTVADAIKTGRCTHIPNAMVYKVLMDPATHTARGLLYIDRNTRAVKEVLGKRVILSAQALESARILMNSSSEQDPAGLGNSSGTLGHYLMDHLWVAGGAEGDFPDLPGDASMGGARRPNGMYVIRFRNTMKGERSKDFVRGYGYQGGGATNFNFNAAGFGEAFKQRLKDETKTSIRFAGFGECLPYFENMVEIDKQVVDTYGIPVLRISMAWGNNEKKMIPDMATAAAEMLEASGAKNVTPYAFLDRVPGYGIHEVGVARMGEDPKSSVLNQFQQTHDVKNLFVMDGAGFPSCGCQNPTLTIMALTVRSCDRLMEEMKRGNV